MKYIQNFTYAMFLLYYCIPHSAAGYFFMSLYILLASLGLSIYHIKEKAYIEGTPFLLLLSVVYFPLCKGFTLTNTPR